MAKLSLAKLERHLYAAADILRREGLDAATYKDYIFGMLFLKRCSDVFDAERKHIIDCKAAQGMTRDEAEKKYGDDPNFYDGFFVPERARWSFLQQRLNDATKPFGSRLDEALVHLGQANTSLEYVLDHIQFMRTQGNKRIVSDEACKELVRHFTRYRLRNADFQFSDLLGSAYEFLINMFAESAGKKGGDFYTPRDVIRLMVRMLDPQPGMSVYDPTCGSGGMLIITREYIEQSGGDPTNLRLAGQVNDASAWSICRLNMLLHGIRGSDIQLQDTLLHPMHRDAGELETFDRVIANPPFSQNYTRSGMEYPERFRWGWCPTSGKKGDLMFAQHMLATCRDRGMVCTVMPHGVLFRGSAERDIRAKWLAEDLLEAVIGLPPNLFYGAGIPACLLILRPNRTGNTPNPNKPQPRRGNVLFINADGEFYAGRAQNYVLPEHIEKIASTFERYERIPGYSEIVSVADITSEANETNLNIRRYVDNAPPPEPHDVRAHLIGGIPTTEIEVQQPLYTALGFDPAHALTPRADEPAYHDFTHAFPERAAIAPLINADTGIQQRADQLRAALDAWWTEHAPRLADLPQTRALNAARREMLDTFTQTLLPLDILDRFKLAGVVASWWNESLPDLKTLIENGFGGVIEGWIDAIADAVVDDDNVGPAFDPFAHKLVRRTMADYLDQIDDVKAEIARLKGEKEAFEQSNPPDDADEEELESWNFTKDLEGQIKERKAEIKEALLPIKDLKKAMKAEQKAVKAADKIIQRLNGTGPKSIARAEKKSEPVEPLQAELEKQEAIATTAQAEGQKIEQQIASIESSVQPLLDQIEAMGAELAPYEQIKADLAEARKRNRELMAKFVEELQKRCAALSTDEQQKLVQELFAGDLQTGLDAAFTARRQTLIRYLANLWDKYVIPLDELQRDREQLQTTLAKMMGGLGYVG